MNKFTLVAASAALLLAACGETTTPETTNAAAPATEAVTPAKPVVADGTYTIDPAGSEVVWIGKKVTREHKGTISLANGTVSVAGGTLVGGTIVVDMTTMTNSDLDAESGANLLGDLAGDDFFSVANHPTATFEIVDFTPNEAGGTAKGNLTIKGVTNTQTIDLSMNTSENGLELRGMMAVDRTKFGIQYGSGSFFENLGDKAIDDMFKLGFFVLAKQ